MRSLFVAALLLAGCHRDSPEDRQRYGLMLAQFQGWAETAARGDKLAPGFGEMARLHCVQARNDERRVEAARPLARACDASLDTIQRAAARR